MARNDNPNLSISVTNIDPSETPGSGESDSADSAKVTDFTSRF